MSKTDLLGATWITSSYSSGNGQCVEVAFPHGAVASADSKEKNGPVLIFPTDGWASFSTAIQHGELTA